MTASAPARDLRADELRLALAGREAPFAVVDLDAWDANAQDLLRRAGRLPVRLGRKSVRCRALVERALPGIQRRPDLQPRRGTVARRPGGRRPARGLPAGRSRLALAPRHAPPSRHGDRDDRPPRSRHASRRGGARGLGRPDPRVPGPRRIAEDRPRAPGGATLLPADPRGRRGRRAGGPRPPRAAPGRRHVLRRPGRRAPGQLARGPARQGGVGPRAPGTSCGGGDRRRGRAGSPPRAGQRRRHGQPAPLRRRTRPPPSWRPAQD